jgi:hypothetical protein
MVWQVGKYESRRMKVRLKYRTRCDSPWTLPDVGQEVDIGVDKARSSDACDLRKPCRWKNENVKRT